MCGPVNVRDGHKMIVFCIFCSQEVEQNKPKFSGSRNENIVIKSKKKTMPANIAVPAATENKSVDGDSTRSSDDPDEQIQVGTGPCSAFFVDSHFLWVISRGYEGTNGGVSQRGLWCVCVDTGGFDWL